MTENGNGHNGITNGNGGTWGKVLTGQQRAFVDAWFECGFNATRAARLAGYQGDDNSLAAAGSRLLRNVKVLEYVQERWAAHGVTAEEVSAHLAGWMRFDPSVLFNDRGGLDMEQVRAHGRYIKRFNWDKGNRLTIELHDSMRAAELIARSLGMFRDRVQVEQSGDLVIRFARPDDV